jgi:hypothetical protein
MMENLLLHYNMCKEAWKRHLLSDMLGSLQALYLQDPLTQQTGRNLVQTAKRFAALEHLIVSSQRKAFLTYKTS